MVISPDSTKYSQITDQAACLRRAERCLLRSFAACGLDIGSTMMSPIPPLMTVHFVIFGSLTCFAVAITSILLFLVF